MFLFLFVDQHDLAVHVPRIFIQGERLRSLTEREALEWILAHKGDTEGSLRDYLEKELPKNARKLDAEDMNYYDLMLAFAEQRAEKQNLPKLKVYSDKDLLKLVE